MRLSSSPVSARLASKPARRLSCLHQSAHSSSATRVGRVDAMNAPVVITSLGACGVKAGAPIVVPPSVGTLFIGVSHRALLANGKKNETTEVITLSLTFDHRVVNGAGAASYAHEIKELIEKFKIPSESARTAVSH